MAKVKPTLLILAAGMGSRYGGLKQIDKLGPSGEVITDYSIYDAIRAGFGKIVFVIRQSMEADFREIFGKYTSKIQIEYAFQELDKLPEGYTVPEGRVKPWGTGHAVLVARDKINEPFVVINADDFYGAGAYRVVAEHLTKDIPDSEKYCMVGFVLENTLSEFGHVSRGVCEVNAGGKLEKINERTQIQRKDGGIAYCDADGSWKSLKGNEIVSMNFWGFPSSFFQHLDEKFKAFIAANNQELKAEFYLPFAVDDLVAEGKAGVTVLKSVDSWFGVTYKEDKPATIEKIQQLVEEGAYPQSVFESLK
jgi:hypothetical protein